MLRSAFDKIAAKLGADRVQQAILTVGLLGMLFVWVRTLYPDADPPMFLPGRYSLREVMVEPIAKATEARNWALFGEWTPNPEDEYQFWRPQSPFWVYPLAGFLKLFGVGVIQLRAFATIYCLLGYLALLAVARRGLKGPEFLLAALIPAIDTVYVLYSRAGLLEPAVNTWISLAVLFVLLSQRHFAWVLAAQWAFVVAFFTKGAAAYAFPLLVGCNLWVLLRPEGAADVRRARAVIAIHAALLGALSAAYILSDFYWRTAIWNFNHVMIDRDEGSKLLVSSLSLSQFWAALTDPDKLRNLRLAAPYTTPLVLFEMAAVVVSLVRKRAVTPFRVIVSAWAACALGAMLVIRSSDLRFSMVMIAPFALCAASGVSTLSGLLPLPKLRRFLAPAAVVAWTGLCVWGFTDMYGTRRYETRRITKAVIDAIGNRRAALSGFWSAPVVFGTPYEHYYVKEHFNTSVETLEQLKINGLLIVSNSDIFQKRFRGWRTGLTPTFNMKLRGTNLRLYLLPKPLERSWVAAAVAAKEAARAEARANAEAAAGEQASAQAAAEEKARAEGAVREKVSAGDDEEADDDKDPDADKDANEADE